MHVCTYLYMHQYKERRAYIYVHIFIHFTHFHTVKGTCVQTFGKYGRNPGELWGPTYVCMTQTQNILVSERMNKRVQVCMSGMRICMCACVFACMCVFACTYV